MKRKIDWVNLEVKKVATSRDNGLAVLVLPLDDFTISDALKYANSFNRFNTFIEKIEVKNSVYAVVKGFPYPTR